MPPRKKVGSARLQRRALKKKDRRIAILKSQVRNLHSKLDQERTRREIVERLHDLDPLTGISNRRSFDLAIERLEADPNILIILFDGNRIGRVNKMVGHKIGDMAILKIAKAITKAVQNSDNSSAHQVWRLGGDEFVVAVRGDYTSASAIVLDAQTIFCPQVLLGSTVIGLEAGIGSTFKEADDQLRAFKRWGAEVNSDAHYLKISPDSDLNPE